MNCALNTKFCYLFSLEVMNFRKRKKNPHHTTSESVMSAHTIIQDVRHSTRIYIYRLVLPGKYCMKINVPCDPILIFRLL